MDVSVLITLEKKAFGLHSGLIPELKKKQQQQVVNMVSFIKEIDVGVGDHLESPKTGGGDDENKILDVIRQVLETKKTDVLASNIKKFYKSDNFEIEEYNKLLGEDEVAMKTKKAWRNLNIEEKRNVGWLAYQKNVISIH